DSSGHSTDAPRFGFDGVTPIGGPFRVCVVPALAPASASARLRHADRRPRPLRLVLLDVIRARRRPDAGADPAQTGPHRWKPGHDADRLQRILLSMARVARGNAAYGGA